MRRIDKGDQVRGVSLKLQEEERQRRMEYVPAQSSIKTDRIVVDKETDSMLKQLGTDFEVIVAGARDEDTAPKAKGRGRR